MNYKEVIFSSNIRIKDLYKDGLQRDQFIPFLKVLENNSYEKELLIDDDYRSKIEAAGMRVTGVNPDTGLVEIVEIPKHPWFVGVQYHPEYKSTVANPHPLFVGFVGKAFELSKNNN